MDITIIALMICLCLASILVGMILQAIILHPYRKEFKRARQREAALQRYRRQLRDLNQ